MSDPGDRVDQDDESDPDPAPVQRCRECGRQLAAGFLCDRCDTVEGWP